MRYIAGAFRGQEDKCKEAPTTTGCRHEWFEQGEKVIMSGDGFCSPVSEAERRIKGRAGGLADCRRDGWMDGWWKGKADT